jgi:hypothetical protein
MILWWPLGPGLVNWIVCLFYKRDHSFRWKVAPRLVLLPCGISFAGVGNDDRRDPSGFFLINLEQVTNGQLFEEYRGH